MEYKKFNEFCPYKMGKIVVNKSGETICDDFISFDTETSHNHNKENPIGWIYQWCFKYGNELIYGRKPSEFVECCKKIIKVNSLDERNKIIIYVHNLSYDYEYIKEFLREEFGYENEKMLAIDKHKLITYEIGGLLFKCSFRLVNKSLDAWSKEIGTKNHKKVGLVDYDVIRYQDTELTKDDWEYMFYDIIVLDEALRLQMKVHNDTLKTIPYTSTGYVRRDAKKEFCKVKDNRKNFKKQALSLETYRMCRSEFAGGITHGNRFFIGETVKGVIKHRDFASHYPTQQVCNYAPCTKFSLRYDIGQNEPINISQLKKMV